MKGNGGCSIPVIPRHTIQDAYAAFRKGRFRAIPLVEEEILVGLITTLASCAISPGRISSEKYLITDISMTVAVFLRRLRFDWYVLEGRSFRIQLLKYIPSGRYFNLLFYLEDTKRHHDHDIKHDDLVFGFIPAAGSK